ncbi:MAG: FtsX-like permease family protein [Pseudomonadales bacterium]|nr:FtsX-like permease family protein [Pseudomonadales bacterium]
MKYFGLIIDGLRRKLLRSILTGISIVIAFLLFGIMNGVTAGFNDALDKMSDVRLRTISRANMAEPLPFAHYHRVRDIDGVVAATPISIFPAYYQEQVNNVVAAGVDIETFTTVFPEVSLSDEEFSRMRTTRTGATVGATLAERYGWQVGDRIPLIGYFTSLKDGSNTLMFDIVSIHNDAEEDEELLAGELYFHYDYLNESRLAQKDTINLLLSVIETPELAGSISAKIDALFANSVDETQTMNEKQFLANQSQSVGDIAGFVTAIQFAVLFTLLFITGSTMTQSVRERTSEFGVLKAVGFADGLIISMVIGESLLLCLLSCCHWLIDSDPHFPERIFRDWCSWSWSQLNCMDSRHCHRFRTRCNHRCSARIQYRVPLSR